MLIYTDVCFATTELLLWCRTVDQFDPMRIWIWLLLEHRAKMGGTAERANHDGSPDRLHPHVYSTETKLFEWSLPVDGRWDDTTSGSSLKSTVSVWKWRWVQCRPPQWRSLPLPVPLRWAAGCGCTAEGSVLQQDVAGGRHSWGQRWWSRTYGSDPMLYRNRFSVIRALSFHSD